MHWPKVEDEGKKMSFSLLFRVHFNQLLLNFPCLE